MNLKDRWTCKLKESREYSKEEMVRVPRGRWLGCSKAPRTGSLELLELWK